MLHHTSVMMSEFNSLLKFERDYTCMWQKKSNILYFLCHPHESDYDSLIFEWEKNSTTVCSCVCNKNKLLYRYQSLPTKHLVVWFLCTQNRPEHCIFLLRLLFYCPIIEWKILSSGKVFFSRQYIWTMKKYSRILLTLMVFVRTLQLQKAHIFSRSLWIVLQENYVCS